MVWWPIEIVLAPIANSFARRTGSRFADWLAGQVRGSETIGTVDLKQQQIHGQLDTHTKTEYEARITALETEVTHKDAIIWQYSQLVEEFVSLSGVRLGSVRPRLFEVARDKDLRQ